MAYEKRFVAFLDILGFKEMIKETYINGEEFNRIKKVLGKIANMKDLNYHDKYPQNEIGKDVSVFSDSIIISYSADMSIGAPLLHILIDLVHLCINLLSNNIFVRGGITFGEIIHNENVCFGPAMIKAYEIEQKEAFYPRIVVDKAAVQKGLLLHGIADTSEIKEYIEQVINEGEDGLFFLDILFASEDEIGNFDEYLCFLNEIKTYLVQHLSKKYPDNVKQKYIWFARYFNETIKKFSLPCINNLFINIDAT